MAKQLVVTTGPDQGTIFTLPAADALFLGRSRASEARLVDPHVSRLHCRVTVNGSAVTVSDNGSAGGTFVNGRRVSGSQVLQVGNVLRIGQTELRLRTVSADDADTVPPAPRPTAQPAGTPVPLGELVGHTLSHYHVGPILAQGHTGVVFHARDTKADLPVALKILLPRLADDETKRQRFVRAMKTVLPLRHANLIQVLGAGKKGACCWIAMEYVEGESLTQVVQRAGVAGMLDWRPALRVAVHVARALEYAHAHQIIHRNVTPMNVLVRGRDRVAKLGDLMLAKALEGVLAVHVTEPGDLLGDLNYLSPERTFPSVAIDERSDLFSLGSTMYALLTGRPPFADVSPIETIKKVRSAEVERPKKFQMSVPDALEGIVLNLLARRPEERYQSAASLLADLERLAKVNGVAV